MLQYIDNDFLKSLKDPISGEIIHIGDEDYYNSIKGLISLLVAQDGFQQKTMGQEDWWEVKELNGKPVDYGIAMLGEIGEAVDSLEFEWWVNGKKTEDIQNLIVELIDALHFELSDIMRIFNEVMDSGNFTIEERREYLENTIRQFGAGISNTFGFERAVCYEDNIYSRKEILELIKMYTYTSLKKYYDTNYQLILLNECSNSNIAEFMLSLFKPVVLLFEILNCFGVSVREGIDRYMLKNALNQVRKLNGYKEGTYEKMWISMTTGLLVEDNVVAIEHVFGKGFELTEMIQELDNYYKDNVKPSLI